LQPRVSTTCLTGEVREMNSTIGDGIVVLALRGLRTNMGDTR
jgi:hypothetical protein